MPIHKCLQCGKEYETKSNRRGYCPDCRIERQKQRNREYLARKNSGQARQIGSADVCEKCGKPYIVKTGSQRLCSECIAKGVSLTKVHNNNNYKLRTYDDIHIFVPKGQKEELKNFASDHGKSLNEFVNEAIALYKKQLEDTIPF